MREKREERLLTTSLRAMHVHIRLDHNCDHIRLDHNCPGPYPSPPTTCSTRRNAPTRAKHAYHGYHTKQTKQPEEGTTPDRFPWPHKLGWDRMATPLIDSRGQTDQTGKIPHAIRDQLRGFQYRGGFPFPWHVSSHGWTNGVRGVDNGRSKGLSFSIDFAGFLHR